MRFAFGRLGRTWNCTLFWVGAIVLAVVIGLGTASADQIPVGWQARNMQPIGFSGLNGRPGAFKLAIKHAANGHWYLFTGHSFNEGWSILDVTNPRDPKYVKFIPYHGPKGLITSQVSLHGNILITAINSATKRPDIGPAVLIWDISDPTNPKQISEWYGGQRGSHRNSYPGGEYAYLAASVPGYRWYILVILDISDPHHPKVAGRWALPGQKDTDPPYPGGSVGFHGPANVSPDGKMISTGFTPYIVNLDISDIAHPKLIGELRMTPPFASVGPQSVHTVLPLWKRHLLYASSEAMASGCNTDALSFAALIDNKDPSKPRLISIFPVPRPPKNAPYKDFCDKGGRFGPHNTNQEIHSPDVAQPGNVMFVTYFNAGLRAFDISDPHLPTEVGWFIPPERPGAPLHTGPHASPINWTEDVLQDTRGNIYISDDKWGVWILHYTGPDAYVPTAK
jgi:hypothetical protein